jgi:cob(I)alamin adenosyltransferase
MCALLVEIQHQLFNLGGELSIPGYELLKPEAVLALDEALATYNEQLPRLQGIHPAGRHRAASQAHVCRTVARRAERRWWRWATKRPSRKRRASTSTACPT